MNDTIKVSVKTQYIAEQSDLEKQQYVYAYTINIENRGAQDTQLISRHWQIIDANSFEQEVKGMGVVGQQPIIKPGQIYTYTSGVIMQTSSGTMQGNYTMRTDDGAEFTAEIPTFSLVQPQALH